MEQRRLNKVVDQVEREVNHMAKRALALRGIRVGQTRICAWRKRRQWARMAVVLDDLKIVAGRKS
jgi:hypothetical protein